MSVELKKFRQIMKNSYTGTVDGELQQLSIDEVNSYVSNAVGNRKLSNSEVETAIQVAMQNVEPVQASAIAFLATSGSFSRNSFSSIMLSSALTPPGP